MKISIVTLKHYRRPRPGSKKGQPRAGIPSWERFGKVLKEAWEVMLGLHHATPSCPLSCPPPPPEESSTTDAYSRGFAEGRAKGFQQAMDLPMVTTFNGKPLEDWHARVEELKAQVKSLQEHNTKEVERRRALEAEFDGYKQRSRDLLHEKNVELSRIGKELSDAKHLLAEEIQTNKDLAAQLAKAKALVDDISSQAVNLAHKTAKLRLALESVEWQTLKIPSGFYSLTEKRCPSCGQSKIAGHEEFCPIGKALTTL